MSTDATTPVATVTLDSSFLVLASSDSVLESLQYSEQGEAVVVEEVTKLLSSAEFADSVTAEVRNLTGTIQEVRESFKRVSDDLVSFDAAEFCGIKGVLPQLRPRWVGYQAVRGRPTHLSFLRPDVFRLHVCSGSRGFWKAVDKTRLTRQS